MDHETQSYLELLDRRIVLLEALANSLVEARRDMVSLDVDGLEARIVQQEKLCVQVGALDGQLNVFQKQCLTKLEAANASAGGELGGGEAAGLRTRLQEIRERMMATQGRVKALNATHQVLLRRCRRTAGALLNMYAKFEVTYAEPVRQRVPVQGRA